MKISRREFPASISYFRGMFPGLVFALLIRCFGAGADELKIHAPGHGRHFHVDPVLGNDGANGFTPKPSATNGPLKTIAVARSQARPGDTIHLAPGVFRESAIFHNCQGEAGRPITLDGHGAILEGADPLNPADWQEISPGLFRNDHLVDSLFDAVVDRWFFLVDGKMNLMGRTSKGPSAALKKSTELLPGEWTFVKDTDKPTADARYINGSFFIRLEPGRKLADARIAAPVRQSGVILVGTNSNLVVRNLTATHFYNDGFNLNGTTRNCRFENIRALDCGDDGISAHEDSQYSVNGFVSIGNATGICDTGKSVTEYANVLIRDCRGFDLYFLNNGRHTLRDTVVLSSAARAVQLDGPDVASERCTLVLDNVLIRRARGLGELRVSPNTLLDARRVTLLGLDFQATGGEVKLRDSFIGGRPQPEMFLAPAVRWQANHNVYDLKSLRVDKTSFAPATFATFPGAAGSETASRWQNINLKPDLPRGLPAGCGADAKALLRRWDQELR